MRRRIPWVAGCSPVSVDSEHAEAEWHAVRFTRKHGQLIAQTREDGTFDCVLLRERSRRAAVDRCSAQTEHVFDGHWQPLCGAEISASFERSVGCFGLLARGRPKPELVGVEHLAILTMALLRLVEQIHGLHGTRAQRPDEFDCRVSEEAKAHEPELLF